ncbi:MAG TPA: sugar phosphate nucleotidyltransferase [Ignavibacteria bacterium]|nr:sugar phosphate nucleotidyltransferase [Ignavibacteria bacterium]
MKAMILSAGFGTRLLPLTNDVPKALVKYKNIPMINYQIERLKNSGVNEIVVNAHHHSKKIIDYFSQNDFGIKINVIVEKEILGTGGGILNAFEYFQNEKSFLVINVDIDTDLNLSDLISFHDSGNSLATLAVQKRKSKKYLEFDSQNHLIGRENVNSNKENLFAFNGIHVISGRIYEKNIETEFKDILAVYFDIINNKNKSEYVCGFDSGKSTFKDIGKIENLNS